MKLSRYAHERSSRAASGVFAAEQARLFIKCVSLLAILAYTSIALMAPPQPRYWCLCKGCIHECNVEMPVKQCSIRTIQRHFMNNGAFQMEPRHLAASHSLQDYKTLCLEIHGRHSAPNVEAQSERPLIRLGVAH